MTDLTHVEARTTLAGTNKVEILLFTLGAKASEGRREVFGINVFKVREVMRIPEITRAPGMPRSVVGMVTQRGILMPVLDLAEYVGIPVESRPEMMLVTEYNGQTQGLLVEGVDSIHRLEWSSMRILPDMMSKPGGGFVNAVTELPDGRLALMLDVERVLSELAPQDDSLLFSAIGQLGLSQCTVLFADDSSIARKQIVRTLDALGVHHRSTNNGLQAWEALGNIAVQAQAAERKPSSYIQAVLTDIEMPEMDGFILTKRIKADPRFADIPVIMHSSLSGEQNEKLGRSVGVDEYVTKFEPKRLADALIRRLVPPAR